MLKALFSMLMLAGCVADEPWPPPLFDCQGIGDRYLLRSLEDGSFVVEIEAAPRGNVGRSTWLHSWTEVRVGHVIGQQGGYQAHLRLNDGQRNLILFEGENGSLSDLPGKTYAGVAAARADGEGEVEMLAECAASAPNRALLQNIAKVRGAAALPDLPSEVENGPFDAWF